MSDNSNSNPESTRSAAEIRQDITDYVLKHADEMPDVPGVKKFVDEHGRLTQNIAEAEERLQRLATAKDEYEPLEQRVTSCSRSLKNAEVELAKLHLPLGTAAFQAFLADDLEDHPFFADRLATHKRVQHLQQERDGLAPSADAGMAQKAKAKAQQLAVTGKIKIEEMKFGGQETEIGRKVVEEKLDESVRCNSTADILDHITKSRNRVSSNTSELQQADAARDTAKKRLCETVPLNHIEHSKSFNPEMKSCKTTVRQSKVSLSVVADSLVRGLSTCESIELPKVLAVKVDAFATAKGNARSLDLQDKSRVAQRVASRLGSSAIRWWSGLSTKGKAITVAVCGVLVVALGAMVTPDRDATTESEMSAGPPIGVDSDAAEANAESTLSAAMKKYPNGYFEKGPNGEEIKVGGDGLGSDWYFHYYLDGDGNKVSHGKGQVGANIPGQGQRGIQNYLKDNGELVVRVTSYVDGKIFAVFTLVKGDSYQKDEYRPLSVGSILHFRSLWKLTKTEKGESHEMLTDPERVKDMPPLSINRGWPIEDDFVYLDMDDILELLGPPNSSYDHVDPESSQSAFVWKQPDGAFTVVIGVRHISGLHRSLVRVNMPRNVAAMIVEDSTGNTLRE
jgi:hypothetical protein